MKSGTRNALTVVAVIVIALAGGVYYLGTNLNGLVAGLIEEQGSKATQTPVRVSGVDIRLTDAAASLSGLSVGNPEGFGGNAIELGDFSVSLDAGTLTSDTIVINDIRVDGARLNVLQKGRSNNLQALLNNLKALQSGDSSEPAEGGKKIIIDRFTLAGASASVSIPELEEMREVELPTIVVRDIGRQSNGATGAQVARQILEPVVQRALSSAAAQSLKDRASETLGEAAGGLLEGLGKALDGEDDEKEPER
jgi:hypothetical protein